MNRVRALRTNELTPDARIERAKRQIADAIDELVEARLAKGAAAAEWIDQNTSPLGKHRHLDLVRRGILKGVKQGKRVLVRRLDIDAYMEDNEIAPKPAADDDVDAMVAAITGGRR